MYQEIFSRTELLLGNETMERIARQRVILFGVGGVEQAVIDRCDGVIEIPQAGTKHSLNIAVSAGAVLWEVYRQHLEAQASAQTASDQETSNQNLQP